EGRRSGTRFAALGFDPRESDLVLRYAWPVFMLNVITDFVAEDASYLSTFRTGEVWHIPVGEGEGAAVLEDPSGEARPLPVRDGWAVVLGLDAGFYTLKAGPKGSEVTSRFAANLVDPEESVIEPRRELVVGGKQAGTVEGFRVGVRSEWWIYLLLAAVLL